MKLQAVIKKHAKKYHKLPFEAKLLFLLAVAIVGVLSKIRNGLTTIKIAQTTIAYAIRDFFFFLIKWPVSFVQKLKSVFQKPHVQKLKPVKLQLLEKSALIQKQKTIVIFPLPLHVKMKYAFFGVAASFFLLFLPLLLLLFIQELPSPHELTYREIPLTTKIFDRNGILLAEVYSAQNRTLVPLSSIPQSLQKATLAIEDKNFYKHPGFDMQAIIRAASENLRGKTIQGGSTITQQLIKSSMLSNEKSIPRKVKEIILAFWTERIYTKDQILEMYFNQVPYGGTAWGAEAASEVYFGKKVNDLTLAQSAFLAGITAAPTTYSPYGEYPTLWKKRQHDVLQKMLQLQFISTKEAQDASHEQLVFKRQKTAYHAPHFVEYIKRELTDRYGLALVEKGGLQVITTLDLKTQEFAEDVVKEEVDNASYLNLSNGAAVITNPENGDILAMVGSKDFSDPNGGNVNIATSLRQPGSTVKVITYSAALANGYTAATILDDSLQTFATGSQPYKPVNYGGRYFGKVPLRFALANSLNLPAVKVLSHIGVKTMVELAKEMGITHWDNPESYGLSVTLGGVEVTMLDMAVVNGTLANNGIKIALHPVLKITDGKGHILEQKTHSDGYRVLDEAVAFIISDILADNQTRSAVFGSHSPLLIPGHRVSVKTGTSDNKRDNWATGYTNNFTVIVWVGNNDNSPMSQELASGITGATPIFNRLMTYLVSISPEKKRPLPKTITQRNCFGRNEYFIQGTENSFVCNRSVIQPPFSINREEQMLKEQGNF